MINNSKSPLLYTLILFLLSGFFIISCRDNIEGQELPAVSELKCDFLTNPLGIDSPHPRFSWVYEDTARGSRQSAYRIILSASREEVEKGRGSIWDTGKISSPETVNIEYQGQELKSGERYFWRVQIWDKKGESIPWSKIQIFQMGLLNPDDWRARWITTPDSSVASPLLRGQFTVKSEIASASVYVTGVGYYELYMNGNKVGDHVLDPAMTDFRKRILYETYDVTDLLKEGNNAWGLWLGNGAFRIKKTEGRWAWHGTNNHFGTPMGVAQLHIHYRDGSEEIIVSDASWKTNASPITYNNLFGGEDYDARLEQQEWNRTGFDDSGWQQVQVVEDPDVLLKSQVMPPIRVTRTFRPVEQTRPDPQTYLFDMGQNFAGWWRVRTEGERGTVLRVRGAETLNDSLFPEPLKTGDRLSTDKAYHRDVWTTYTLKGGGTETYEPRYFYTGYRYVEVKVDDPSKVNSVEVEGRVIHSDLERNGHFTSSDTLLNQIYEAAIWSQRGNLHGYPTDCPHREKGGYNGDGQVIAEASLHDFHMHSFYEKWLDDMRDAQQENGRIPNTSPTIIGGHGGGIAWGSAYILIPWWMHQYYGDERILDTHYPAMKRYLAYLRNLAANDEDPEEEYIIDEFGGHWDSLGEWEAPVRERNGPVNPLTNTYYWYLDTVTLANIAGKLGSDEDRQEFLVLADSIKSAFNRKFFNPETNLYGTDEPYQSYLLFALGQNMVPDGHQKAVLDNLTDDIMVNREGHLGTGILGTKHLFSVLAGFGREDIIHRVVTQKTFPSWGYWIENGATTLWENWKGESSHNHQMFGSVNEYFYKYLAGIRSPMDSGTSAGYREIHIKPYIPEGMSHAEASVVTVRGTVSSRWERTGDQLHLSVSLPANTSGKVSIPTLGLEKVMVTESGNKIWGGNGLTENRLGISEGARTGNYIDFNLVSGSYSFELSHLP